jgi:hypothetical protein
MSKIAIFDMIFLFVKSPTSLAYAGHTTINPRIGKAPLSRGFSVPNT